MVNSLHKLRIFRRSRNFSYIWGFGVLGLRVALSADYQRLEFLRVLRSHQLDPITDAGALVAPPILPGGPDTSEALETGAIPAAGTQPDAAPDADAGSETDGGNG